MIAVIQRVTTARVIVDKKVIASINTGMAILLGVQKDDEEADVNQLSEKITSLRIFPNKNGQKEFDRSILDMKGEMLIISQFTLLAHPWSGRRPDFSDAATSTRAKMLYESVANNVRMMGIPVKTGEFGASMEVELVNDGPVTIVVDTRKLY